MDFLELEKRLQRADTLLDLDRPAEALPLLLEAFAEAPEDHRAACLVARCYIALEDHKKAVEYANKAISVAAEAEWGYRLKAISLGSLGRKKEELAAAEEAVRCAPEAPETLFTLANALRRSRKPERAREVTQRLLELAPDQHDTHNIAGLVEHDLGFDRAAEKHFREALKINPTSFAARNNLGLVALGAHQDKEEAIEHFQAAVRLAPADQIALENLQLQLTVLPYLTFYLFLLPVLIIGLLITPLYVIIFIAIAIYVLIKAYFKNLLTRRKLSAEFKMLFRSQGFRGRWRTLRKGVKSGLANLLAKFWKVYAVAGAALAVKLLAFYYNSNFLAALSIFIFIGCGFIIRYNQEDDKKDHSIFKL